MNFEDLTPEQMEKAKACKTPEDILALAKESGYELSDEELSSISGGGKWFGGPYSDTCNANSCSGYSCYAYYCSIVSCRSLSCGTYDADDVY